MVRLDLNNPDHLNFLLEHYLPNTVINTMGR